MPVTNSGVLSAKRVGLCRSRILGFCQPRTLEFCRSRILEFCRPRGWGFAGHEFWSFVGQEVWNSIGLGSWALLAMKSGTLSAMNNPLRRAAYVRADSSTISDAAAKCRPYRSLLRCLDDRRNDPGLNNCRDCGDAGCPYERNCCGAAVWSP